ncbi:MAG TPA: pilus assembly protein PilM [Pirellulaceae bacterium]|nr:pilus assembly protein PilM [Pirellulaceae bacterium]
MAKNSGVWGIDIGRCALKALRCRLDGDNVVADAFDYIEYPKLLSQPEADPAQLVKEALEQFLSRNTVKGDRVAISVSGESGLARYFKPPPVDVKKIADLVKFEARQQIPFALEDVIWDYQRMAGGQEVDGFVLESEIGLFAMKREQVTKTLAPFKAAAIEVDIIQLAPIAVYNFATYDFIKGLPEGQVYNPEDPPPSTVILSIGTDTTDLVVTNGYRVWQRNIPLGGNHFTKQLSKDLKLTFAKAEHLKRNPRQADDPKAIFQAMRPVFGDLVTEVQRSVGFFQSLDRKAKITSFMLLGNTVKLPGLGQYLSKHLGYDIKELNAFSRLTGSGVVSSPAFKDNVLTFATCYGLCVQGLNQGKLSTNLLPREIMTERMIRAKKPWAIAALAALALGLGLNYVFWYRTYEEVHPENTVHNVTWTAAKQDATEVQDLSNRLTKADTDMLEQLKKIDDFHKEVAGTSDRRRLWLELLRAINVSLPQTKLPEGVTDVYKLPFDQRQELHIEYIETEYFKDLSKWWTQPKVKDYYLDMNPHLRGGAAADPAGTTAPPPASSATPAPAGTTAAPAAAGPGGDVAGPTGAGWVVELKGYHYFHDSQDLRRGPNHVRDTLIKNLEHGFVSLPTPDGAQMQFKMDELGIGWVIPTYFSKTQKVPLPNPNADYAEASGSAAGVGGYGGNPMPTGAKKKDAPKIDPDNPPYFDAHRTDFNVQFVWQEKPLNERLEERLKKAAQPAAVPPATPPATPTDGPAAPPATAAPAAATTPAPGASGAPLAAASPAAGQNGTVPAAPLPPVASPGPGPAAAPATIPDAESPAEGATATPPAAPMLPPATVPEIPEAAPSAPPASAPAPKG